MALPRRRPVLPLLLCSVALLWALRLNRSIWLDESLTYFIVKDGALQAAARAWRFQGQTPAYYLIEWLIVYLLGPGEVALRFLSFAAVGGAACMLYLLAARIADRHTAAVAVLIFAVAEPVAAAATDARPYGLALLFSLTATIFLFTWNDRKSSRDLFFYWLFLTATVYTHYLFGQIVLIHLLYLVGRRVQLRGLVSYFLVVLAMLLALVPAHEQVISLAARAGALSFAPHPGLESLLGALLLPHLLVPLILAAILIRLYSPPAEGDAPPVRRFAGAEYRWIWGWYLLPPLAAFVASRWSGHSFFTLRYFLVYLPGYALLLALIVRRYYWPQRMMPLAAVFYLFAAIGKMAVPQLVQEDWRAAARYAQEVAADPSSPLLLFSGLIETRSLSASSPADAETQQYLLAPLNYYSFPGRPLPLPLVPGEREAEAYWERSVVPHIGEARAVTLVILENLRWRQGESELRVPGYFKERLRRRGFEVEAERRFERVWVIRMKKVT